MERDHASNQLLEFAKAKREPDTLSSSNGRPLEDITVSMTAGKKGPIVLQVFFSLPLCISCSFSSSTPHICLPTGL